MLVKLWWCNPLPTGRDWLCSALAICALWEWLARMEQASAVGDGFFGGHGAGRDEKARWAGLVGV